MTINDPLTGHTCVNKVDVSGNCSSTYIRTPFPGNVIPRDRISPVAQKILSYYPAPNTNGMVSNFVAANSTGKYFYDQPMGRWDRVIDERNRVNALITFQRGQEYRNQTGIPGLGASGNIGSRLRHVSGARPPDRSGALPPRRGAASVYRLWHSTGAAQTSVDGQRACWRARRAWDYRDGSAFARMAQTPCSKPWWNKAYGIAAPRRSLPKSPGINAKCQEPYSIEKKEDRRIKANSQNWPRKQSQAFFTAISVKTNRRPFFTRNSWNTLESAL